MKILYYDGTYEGFLTSIYDGFYLKAREIQIVSRLDNDLSLFESIYVQTDLNKVNKVKKAITEQLEQQTADIVYMAWLSCQPQIDTDLLYFLKLSFHYKKNICNMMHHALVNKIVKRAKRVGGEAHRFLGFVRFRKARDYYIADIHPDARILPLIANHFADRLREETFVIRDTHFKEALIKHGLQWTIVPMDNMIDIEFLVTETAFESM